MIAPISGKKLLIIVNVLKLPHMEYEGGSSGRLYIATLFGSFL